MLISHLYIRLWISDILYNDLIVSTMWLIDSQLMTNDKNLEKTSPWLSQILIWVRYVGLELRSPLESTNWQQRQQKLNLISYRHVIDRISISLDKLFHVHVNLKCNCYCLQQLELDTLHSSFCWVIKSWGGHFVPSREITNVLVKTLPLTSKPNVLV